MQELWENVEYPFIVLAPRSTVKNLSTGWIELFDI